MEKEIEVRSEVFDVKQAAHCDHSIGKYNGVEVKMSEFIEMCDLVLDEVYEVCPECYATLHYPIFSELDQRGVKRHSNLKVLKCSPVGIPSCLGYFNTPFMSHNECKWCGFRKMCIEKQMPYIDQKDCFGSILEGSFLKNGCDGCLLYDECYVYAHGV